MPRLRWLPSARGDLYRIIEYIARESKSTPTGRRFAAVLKDKCANLASLRATLGVARPELGIDIRSLPFRGYVIFFRYRGGYFEVINIIEGHRDFDAYFARTQATKSGSDPE